MKLDRGVTDQLYTATISTNFTEGLVYPRASLDMAAMKRKILTPASNETIHPAYS
jgi:hypothetical protein